MAALELDPLFLKALSLLRSKSRDSADQLKALLDEVLGKKTKKESGKDEGGGNSKTVRKKDDGKHLRKPDDRTTAVKRVLDKPPLSKFDAVPTKKLKTDNPRKVSTIRKPVIDDEDDDDTDDDGVFEAEKPSEVINISSDSDDLEVRRGRKRVIAPRVEESDESTNMDDFALELGLACMVCKKMDVSAKNKLFECQECHSLYHQFCHKPPVTVADANDPRLVWYCTKCLRNMRKSVDKKPMKSSSSLSELSGLDKKSGEQAINLFKRSEPKTPPVSSVGKSQPFTGLANFAANVAGKGSSSIKTSSLSSKPSTIIGKSNNIRVNMSSGPTKSASLSSNRTIISKFKSSSSTESRSPSPQPSMGSSKGKSVAVKNMPQMSQASAMKRLQQMKRKASKR